MKPSSQLLALEPSCQNGRGPREGNETLFQVQERLFQVVRME